MLTRLTAVLVLVQAHVLLKAEADRGSRCAPGCSTSGTCNEELGRCDCRRGWHGDACDIPPKAPDAMCKEYSFHGDANCSFSSQLPVPCLNACNSRGTCLAGWCHCQPGFFGADCSLSLPSGAVTRADAGDGTGTPGRPVPVVLEGLGYTPRARKPHVYVYDLPPRYTTWHNIRRHDRPLHFMFWQRLLGAGVLVADGEQADLFYIPVSVRNPSESRRVVGAIKYLRKTWPWWNATGGARHVLIHTGDAGRAEMLADALRLTRRCFLLTHWGLHQDFPLSGWRTSHRPGHDVVVPVAISSAYKSPRGAVFRRSPLHPGAAAAAAATAAAAAAAAGSEAAEAVVRRVPPAHRRNTGNTMGVVKRDIELLFAGRICGDGSAPRLGDWPNCGSRSRGYSQGVRQEVHFHHHNRTGYVIAVSDPQYGDNLARAKFCLAPTGGGHGHRQVLVMFAGCVPLLIGDYVHQPFEPELPWPRFSLSANQSDIPQLHTRLAAVDDDQLARLQANLPCAAQHMMWTSMSGAFMEESGAYDAFETTLEILRMRLAHPNADPATYTQLDLGYAAFVECQGAPMAAPPAGVRSQPGKVTIREADNGGDNEVKPVAGSGKVSLVEDEGSRTVNTGVVRGRRRKRSAADRRRPGLCSLSWLDGDPPPCYYCKDKYEQMVPGGAACCWVEHLGVCPRIWA